MFLSQICPLVANFCLLYLFIFVTSYSVWLVRIVIMLFLLVSSMSVYIRIYYGTIVDKAIFLTFIDQYRDFGDVFDIKMIFWFFLIFVIPTIFVFKFKIIRGNDSKKINVVMLIIAMLSSIPLIDRDYFVHRAFVRRVFLYTPLNYLDYCYRYIRYEIALRSIESYQEDIVKDLHSHANKGTPKKIVLVIGESARVDHFGINGYARDTTPNLNQIKDLVSFSYVKPCATSTMFAVPCILSRNTKENMKYPLNENTIISVFQDLGFVTSWLSTQGSYLNERFLLQVSAEAQNTRYGFMLDPQSKDGRRYDGALLPLLQEVMNSDKNDFIILHTMGSHTPFRQRYPESFQKFVPVCQGNPISSCRNQEEIINTYDNTVLYTDYFLSETIKILKDQDALLVYVSDHGQYLGEDGVYGHGGDANHQAHNIPMFVWMSDKLLKKKVFRHKLKLAVSSESLQGSSP